MLVNLAYDRGWLPLEAPPQAVVIEPRYSPPLPSPLAALREALAHPIGTKPLAEILKPWHKVTIVHCDGTRAMPNALVIAALSEVLAAAGIPDSQITLLNALGTHRRNTPEELEALLGAEAIKRYRCEQAVAADTDAHVPVGQLPDNTPVKLHKCYVEADIRILLGFIEPHFFAGFSGGPKLIAPGISSLETIFHLHSPALVGHPKAIWGITAGNPLWETLRAVAALAPPTFIVNVALNRDKEVTAVFAGDLDQAHQAGIAYVRERSMCRVPHLFDIVVTTNSGFPLDQNLYQSVKGMSAAARIVKPGGAIIIAAGCADGIPNHGAFFDIVREGGSPDGILQVISRPGYHRCDQWQAQVLALIRKKARILIYTAGVDEEAARAMMLEPISDIGQAIDRLAKEMAGAVEKASICIMPEGPQTIPYVTE